MASEAYRARYGDKPVTELHNDFSTHLDGGLPAKEFLSLLRSADAQVFTGWSDFPGLYDFSDECERVAECISSGTEMRHTIMTGCGTSGRLAFLTARRYNDLLANVGQGRPFGYLCAGGDPALLLSDELPEDDPEQGARELQALRDAYSTLKRSPQPTMVIGITCGLSAPYVAGQIDACIRASSSGENSGLAATLLGFNPTCLARDKCMERDAEGRSFRDVATEFEELRASQEAKVAAAATAAVKAGGGGTLSFSASPQSLSLPYSAFLVNPVVGPEPIAGSSRMKGGTATAVLLDAICLRACGLRGHKGHGSFPEAHFMHHLESMSSMDIFAAYQSVHARTYASILSGKAPALCTLMEAAAQSLRIKGRLFYIGQGAAAGAVGFIDASEMPDTYGSPFDQIRGFISTGWDGLGNTERDISDKSPLLRLSLEHFNVDIAPGLNERDTVVFLFTPEADSGGRFGFNGVEKRVRACAKACQARARVFALAAVCDQSDTSSIIDTIGKSSSVLIKLPQILCWPGTCDFTLKLLTNAVSTFAQAKGRGALFRGLMVATGPANDKIYQRCVSLIASTVGVDPLVAELSLVRAIYRRDDINADDALLSCQRSVHIKASLLPEDQRGQPQIVLPIALLIATGQWRVSEAEHALAEEPRVSVLLEKFLAARIETGVEEGGGGVEGTYSYSIGIDVGGSNVRVGLVKQERTTGRVILVASERATFVSGKTDMATVVECTVHCLEKLKGSDAVRLEGVALGTLPIGVGQPGSVDTNGCVSNAVNLAWAPKSPLRASLDEALRAKGPHWAPRCIFVLDDADAALLAEVPTDTQATGTYTVAMLSIGTGVGSGVWTTTGKLHRGKRHLIEAGHIVVQPKGPSCACGQRGCLETLCSGPGIAERFEEFTGITNTTTADVCAMAADWNSNSNSNSNSSDFSTTAAAAAAHVVDTAAFALAQGCLALIRILDPNEIVLAGSLAPVLIEATRAHYRELQWHLHDDLKSVEIRQARSPLPGVVGAAMAVLGDNLGEV